MRDTFGSREGCWRVSSVWPRLRELTAMKLQIVGLVAAVGLAVSACETATPYQPLQQGTSASGGFTDQKLDQNHFRVTFQGNTLTSRETVETYLLFRTAELTAHALDSIRVEHDPTDGDESVAHRGVSAGRDGTARAQFL